VKRPEPEPQPDTSGEDTTLHRQELQACEIAYQGIESHEECILRWFTTEVLKYPPEWSAMVCMALLEKNKAGNLRWREAKKSPLGLVSTITWRAAWKWHPELHFHGDEKRTAQATRPFETNLSQFDQEDEDGERYNAVLDQACAEEGGYHASVGAARWSAGVRAWNGIPRSSEDDPQRAAYVDFLLARLSWESSGGFNRHDSVASNPETLVSRATRIAARDGKRAGTSWLRSQADTLGYSEITIRAMLRSFERLYRHYEVEVHSIGYYKDSLGLYDSDEFDSAIRLDDPTIDTPFDSRYNWLKVCRRVGFTEEEAIVVMARAEGITREEMKAHPDWRQCTEAAWKDVQRTFKRPDVRRRFIDALGGRLPDVASWDFDRALQKAKRLFSVNSVPRNAPTNTVLVRGEGSLPQSVLSMAPPLQTLESLFRNIQ
jgi:hypothetical protein